MRREHVGEIQPIGDVGPGLLADLMLALPLRSAVTLCVLEPSAGGATLFLEHAGEIVHAFTVSSDVATAACARIAIAAGLDVIAKAGTSAGHGNVTRLPVRAGADVGTLLVAVVAREDGLGAEVRALSINGREPRLSRAFHLKRCTRCSAYQPTQRTRCDRDDGELVEVRSQAEPGGTIGQYTVGELLGSGGDALVYRGAHALIGKQVAIKVLRRINRRQDSERFLSEARAISRLRHRSIVEVTDFGLLPTGEPYTVMEHLEGRTLHDHMPTDLPLDPRFALRVAREIAEALGAAHAAGIVHNDLKPANVMLLAESTPERPRLKVLDFGASSLLGHRQDAQLVYGTAAYMSPELAHGEPTDGRSDVYALGILLYEMLSGELPFTGDTVIEILRQHLQAPVPPMTNPLPPSITTLVSQCLRKSPEERPRDAAQLIAAIDQGLAALDRPVWRRFLP